jgi:hypothetical protein
LKRQKEVPEVVVRLAISRFDLVSIAMEKNVSLDGIRLPP